MVKTIYWIVIIATGVFIGFVAFDWVKNYQAGSAGEPPLQSRPAVTSSGAVKPLGAKVSHKDAHTGKDRGETQQKTMCTFDPDTDECACVDRETGQPIPKPHYDCILRASKN